MESWAIVREVYGTQLDIPANAAAAQGMIDLVDHLQTLPDFAALEAGLAGLALAITVPDRRQRVHISWERPYTYAVFLDFCEPAFYGERVTVEIEDVVQTIRDYLDRVRGGEE